jgi:hypothetical protein
LENQAAGGLKTYSQSASNSCPLLSIQKFLGHVIIRTICGWIAMDEQFFETDFEQGMAIISKRLRESIGIDP